MYFHLMQNEAGIKDQAFFSSSLEFRVSLSSRFESRFEIISAKGANGAADGQRWAAKGFAH